MAGGLLILALLPATAEGATVAVTTTADEAPSDPDNGMCALREAIEAANDNAGVDSCVHGGGSAPDTIQLAATSYAIDTGPDGTPDDNEDGDLDVQTSSGDLTLLGGGVNSTTIDGAGLDRVLHALFAGGTLTLQRLRVTGGSTAAAGGGILVNAGALVVDEAELSNNLADFGGAIASTGSAGPLSVIDSTVSLNRATNNGGGIQTNDPLTVTSSAITGNSVVGTGTNLVGGGISRLNSVTVTLMDAIVTGNHVELSSAQAAQGGGIYLAGASGTLNLVRSTVSGNFLNNTAGGSQDGGGIYQLAGTLNLTNSTISGNSAPDGPSASGGAVSLGGGTVNVAHTTVAANEAATGNDAFAMPVGAHTIRNSIVSEPDDPSACFNAFTSAGHNVDAGSSCWSVPAAGDLQGADAMLGPLAANGGPTQTHALGAASPAIDRAPTASCTATDGTTVLTTDQRGMPRPFAAACDSGGYERVSCLGVEATVPGLVGTGAPDTIDGTSGPDVLLGMGGNDSLAPGGADDRVCGGAGTDAVSFAGGARVVASTTGASGQGADAFSEIEGLVGSSFADRLAGDALANSLFGGLGRDLVLGRAGNDSLLGEGGRDTLRGQAGRDRLFGGQGPDRLSGGKGKRDRCNGGKGKDMGGRGCERGRGIP